MCDYSTHGLTTRDAVVGDHLVLDCLGQDGSKGFIAESDVSEKNPTVVCLKCGTALTLRDIPQNLQALWGVGATTLAIFDQRTPNPLQSLYRDGVLIPGHAEGHVSLQELPFGLKVTVTNVENDGRRGVTEPTRVLESA